MKFSWDELDHITAILEDEMNGRDIDRTKARQLAEYLVTACPDIANTLANIMSRMGCHDATRSASPHTVSR